MNTRGDLRRVFAATENRRLVWALDDVDRLFTRPFGSEVLALLRAWHNERALDPGGPWSRSSSPSGVSR